MFHIFINTPFLLGTGLFLCVCFCCHKPLDRRDRLLDNIEGMKRMQYNWVQNIPAGAKIIHSGYHLLFITGNTKVRGKSLSPALGACCLDQKRVSLPQYSEWSLWSSGGVYTPCKVHDKTRTSKPFLFYQMRYGWLRKGSWERKTVQHLHSQHFLREILSSRITWKSGSRNWFP